MSSDIPEEYLNELKEAFVHFDKDSDGFIQTGDLGNYHNLPNIRNRFQVPQPISNWRGTCTYDSWSWSRWEQSTRLCYIRIAHEEEHEGWWHIWRVTGGTKWLFI